MLTPFDKKYVFRITQPYSSSHKGLDMVNDFSDDILSVTSGRVLSSQIITEVTSRTWEWGNYVTIGTPDGLSITYAHLSERKVRKGEKVEQGQLLGYQGSTGKSTGKHLHLQIRLTNSTNIVEYSPAVYLAVVNAVGQGTHIDLNGFLKNIIGLSIETIEYIANYKYGEELIRKIYFEMYK